ncbi:MAG: hypothetical protein WCK02_16595 [Bacteroidota bacterium]
MAVQKSLLRLEGTIGGMTFYKSKDGYLVREKGSVSADRIKKDPSFARTRENNEEFRLGVQASRLIRSSVPLLLSRAADNTSASRMNSIMIKIGKTDATSARGQRNPQTALANAVAKALLKSFNFNSNAEIGRILLKQWTITPATGVIGIANLIPATDIIAPIEATHFSLTGGIGVYNFGTGVFDVKYTNIVNSIIGSTLVPVTLTPTSLPAGTGIKLYFLKLEFFQLVNGVQYALQNCKDNALTIIEVA